MIDILTSIVFGIFTIILAGILIYYTAFTTNNDGETVFGLIIVMMLCLLTSRSYRMKI